MIVKLNGKYTKQFLEAFYTAFNQDDYQTFETFCRENELTVEDTVELIEIFYGDNYVNNQ
jgi:hypothetical protein